MFLFTFSSIRPSKKTFPSRLNSETRSFDTVWHVLFCNLGRNQCWSNFWFYVMTLNLTEWSLIKGPWKCDVDGDVLWVWCLESDSPGWLQCSPEHWTPVSGCDWTFTVTISAILGQGESVVSVLQTWWTPDNRHGCPLLNRQLGEMSLFQW